MAEQYFDYEKMMTEIDFYMNKYKFISVNGICESILGRMVPAIILGSGKRVVVYVGGEAGNDNVSSALLVRFVRDVCALYSESGSAFGFSAENIFKNYTVVIIPMLNPDGSMYCSKGVGADNPLRERALKINRNNEDFSAWSKNARGIELKYDYGFDSSEKEPEPEVGALCNFLRYGLTPSILISFSHSLYEEETIYFGDGEIENKMSLALSQMSGMKRVYRVSENSNLMITDWSQKELSTASFSFELPRIKCSNYKQYSDSIFSTYAKLRKIFFCAPFLNKIK